MSLQNAAMQQPPPMQMPGLNPAGMTQGMQGQGPLMSLQNAGSGFNPGDIMGKLKDPDFHQQISDYANLYKSGKDLLNPDVDISAPSVSVRAPTPYQYQSQQGQYDYLSPLYGRM